MPVFLPMNEYLPTQLLSPQSSFSPWKDQKCSLHLGHWPRSNSNSAKTDVGSAQGGGRRGASGQRHTGWERGGGRGAARTKLVRVGRKLGLGELLQLLESCVAEGRDARAGGAGNAERGVSGRGREKEPAA